MSEKTPEQQVLAVKNTFNESRKLVDPKYTDGQIERVAQEAVKLVGRNKSKSEIVKSLTTQFSITEKMSRKAYNHAVYLLRESVDELVEDVRAKRIEGLKRDMEEAYFMYMDEDTPQREKVTWFKIYLEIKSKIDAFYPNKLQMQEQDKDNTINITYDLGTKAKVIDIVDPDDA